MGERAWLVGEGEAGWGGPHPAGAQCVQGSAQGLGCQCLTAPLRAEAEVIKTKGSNPVYSRFWCLCKDSIFRKWCIKKSHTVVRCFWEFGQPRCCSFSEWTALFLLFLSYKKKRNRAVGTELIVHYFPDLQLFRKTRNGSIRGLFLSVWHGRSKCCRSAKRERTISVLLEL